MYYFQNHSFFWVSPPPWNCFLVEIPIRPWCAQLICLLPDSWDNPLRRLLLRLLKNRFWGSFQIVVLRIFQLRRSQILVEGSFWFWYVLYRNKSGINVFKQKEKLVLNFDKNCGRNIQLIINYPPDLSLLNQNYRI